MKKKSRQKASTSTKPNKPISSNDTQESRRPHWLFLIWVIFLVVVLSSAHSVYLFNLFENDRFFSHLSDLEREMSYRTEMGLYFSFYKTVVQAPTLWTGLSHIIKDNVTEAGHTINALQRFNIYPEAWLAALFRVLRHYTKGWNLEQCYQINRGHGLRPVNSCEGVGNLHFFYVYAVFAWAGSVLGSVFLLGLLLSESVWGGLLSAAAFLFNHGHATRVQWTPPLRESFGFPAFFCQLAVLTAVLRYRNPSALVLTLMSLLSLLCILFWQFSVFVLFIQVTALLVTADLGTVHEDVYNAVWASWKVAFTVSYIAMFGNSLLLSSLFCSSLAAFWLSTRMFKKVSPGLIKVVASSTVFLLVTVTLKFGISTLFGIKDDDHVFDILRSKFSDFSTFHTRLYTCAAEFDFIDVETVKELFKTMLLPTAAVSFIMVVLLVLKLFFRSANRGPTNVEILSPVVFNTGVLVIFCVMAVLIMRLKLFAVPQLCAFCPVFLNEKLMQSVLGVKIKWKSTIVIVLISIMAYQGSRNISKQLSIQGEYNNAPQELLFDWIEDNTAPDAVFAGSMPVMANVRLSTGRAIYNHPHYEDIGVSRRNIHTVYKDLHKVGINYFVFEPRLCGSHQKSQCTYLAMWDQTEPQSKKNPSICSILNEVVNGQLDPHNIAPFSVVYNSQSYVVLEIPPK